MKEAFELLGFRMKDKVTGYEGVVASVSFDLYGCVQATLCPAMDKEGKLRESFWFDVKRLEKVEEKRVLTPPNFLDAKYGTEIGSANKPRFLNP